MSSNPNTNNLVSYRERGFKRGKNIQVRFNNRTGCRQVVCKKNKKGCVNKVISNDIFNGPTYKIGETTYVLEAASTNIGPILPAGIYAWAMKGEGVDSIYKSGWEVVVSESLRYNYGSRQALNNCFKNTTIQTRLTPTIVNKINISKNKITKVNV